MKFRDEAAESFPGKIVKNPYGSGHLYLKLLSTYTNYYVVLQRIIFEPFSMNEFINSFLNLSH